jgi:hypothetical protein
MEKYRKADDIDSEIDKVDREIELEEKKRKLKSLKGDHHPLGFARDAVFGLGKVIMVGPEKAHEEAYARDKVKRLEKLRDRGLMLMREGKKFDFCTDGIGGWFVVSSDTGSIVWEGRSPEVGACYWQNLEDQERAKEEGSNTQPPLLMGQGFKSSGDPGTGIVKFTNPFQK